MNDEFKFVDSSPKPMIEITPDKRLIIHLKELLEWVKKEDLPAQEDGE